jgi:hypothetical protein
MTRLITLAIVVMTAAASFGLYQLSYDVRRMEDELSELNRAITQDRENILVLEAEWSYLTRPDVLQERATKLLELKPTSPKQIVNAQDIPSMQERLKVAPAPSIVSSRPGARPPARPAVAATPVASVAAGHDTRGGAH